MKSFIRIASFTEYLNEIRHEGKTVGFVPTMGALHQGHISLIRRSKKENDITVCSIFVNPIQFNNASDLTNYPRRMEQDTHMLEDEGVDLLFAPESEEMYPPDELPELDLDFGRLDKVMEGKYRPGHFRGVAIVVKKLFDIVQPHRAYFGKKDFQQLRIIEFMVHHLKIPVDIIPCTTIREPDGLAMSSRNLRLSIGERETAPLIYNVLMYIKAHTGKMPVKKLQLLATKQLTEDNAFQVDYIDIVDTDTLLPIQHWNESHSVVACIAAYLNDIRLIDNMELFS